MTINSEVNSFSLYHTHNSWIIINIDIYFYRLWFRRKISVSEGFYLLFRYWFYFRNGFRQHLKSISKSVSSLES